VYLGGTQPTPPIELDSLSDLRTGEVGVAASAGDVNADGYGDLFVATNGDSLYVYLGGASGTTSTPIVVRGLPGGMGNGQGFGSSAASAGDINGDGYADLIVGAPSALGTTTTNAYVYLGTASGPSLTPATTLTGPGVVSSDITISRFGFGASVGSAGDINGDGYADVIVGAPGLNTLTGNAYVYLGGATGLSMNAMTLSGVAAGDMFGTSVGSAGDVNGDGFGDILVGAPGAMSGAGAAYVYLGGASGLSATPVTVAAPAGAAAFGTSVASAGDVNGDGRIEDIVGAPDTNGSAGAAYVAEAGMAAPITLAPGIAGAAFGYCVQ
jgi:hypothetical protein